MKNDALRAEAFGRADVCAELDRAVWTLRAENARLTKEKQDEFDIASGYWRAWQMEKAENARYREALDPENIAAIIRRADGNHSLGAGELGEAIAAALSGAPHEAEGVSQAPGIWLTLEQAREIEWAGDDDATGQSCTCIVCKEPEWASATRHGRHAPDCWLAAAIRQAEEVTQ